MLKERKGWGKIEQIWGYCLAGWRWGESDLNKNWLKSKLVYFSAENLHESIFQPFYDTVVCPIVKIFIYFFKLIFCDFNIRCKGLVAFMSVEA